MEFFKSIISPQQDAQRKRDRGNEKKQRDNTEKEITTETRKN